MLSDVLVVPPINMESWEPWWPALPPVLPFGRIIQVGSPFCNNMAEIFGGKPKPVTHCGRTACVPYHAPVTRGGACHRSRVPIAVCWWRRVLVAPRAGAGGAAPVGSAVGNAVAFAVELAVELAVALAVG